ncbi:LytTR family DNA-binding domain-containing protein [Streptomyces sp. HPF1205]|uniref:LytR/AlgR family response regulator transcription factor n=1 Tax=Streptomyces sp. HPF1205 TaxID=2873262 RepID=UPI001CED732A|nr:response regulator transcription factor [Streptomyces sp. HPF1205]
MLRILAVDDEPPALSDLVYLLGQDPRVARVEQACDGGSALRALAHARAAGEPLDGVFLDIRMPGLDGLDVARLLLEFTEPPAVVFVSAHDDFALGAFELRAVDYLLKPVRTERLAEAVRRVAETRAQAGPAAPAADPGRPAAPAPEAGPGPAAPAAPPPADDPVIAVERSGVTRFIRRSDVRHVEAYGDYVRLHLPTGHHLLRVPLSTLERQWRDAGFVRVHRRHLVAAAHIEELRTDSGRLSVRVGDAVLPVSRRSARRLREVLAGDPVRRPTGRETGHE